MLVATGRVVGVKTDTWGTNSDKITTTVYLRAEGDDEKYAAHEVQLAHALPVPAEGDEVAYRVILRKLRYGDANPDPSKAGRPVVGTDGNQMFVQVALDLVGNEAPSLRAVGA